VELGEGDYWSDKFIVLPEGIKTTIKGKGKNNTTLNLTKWIKGSSGFLILHANGSSVKDMTVNVKNNMGYGSPAVSTNGKQDCYFENVTFANASIGTGTPDNGTGLVPAGLTVVKCDFLNCDHGINFNRLWKKVPAKWVKKITIDRCSFRGKQSAGISLDCGNDGLDGNCTFEKAKKYNIAIAKGKNIVIKNNTLKGTTGAIRWGENINLEHEARNIWIEGNTIENMGLWDKDQSYISILTFRDYKNTPSFENGCRNIFIRWNNFKGAPKLGISGEFAKDITINGNTFKGPKPTQKHINFYTKSVNISHWDNKGVDKSKISVVAHQVP